MSFNVAEIRDRSERLHARLAVERYETRAGLKGRSNFAGLFSTHRFLLGPEILPAIQRELAVAEGDNRRRLTALFGWVARQHIEAELAPLEDELRAWESGATVALREREVPLRRVPAAIARSPQRGVRMAWEAARNRRAEEASALRLDVVQREREAVRQLGLGDFLETWERISGLDLHGVARQAIEILTRTEAPYRAAFLREVSRRIGAEARSAARSDATWLNGIIWLSQPFAINPLLVAIRRDLDEMELPLPREGVVRIDFDRRPLKEAQSFCAAIRVPGDVVLVVSPVGGWSDARSLLHEIGHTLHFTYTSATLPWEDRALGDTSVTETFAVLFESLTLDPDWVSGSTGLTGATLSEYLALAGFLQLYRLRRTAALLLYEMELAVSTGVSELAARYVAVLGGATGFAHDPLDYLEDVRRGFWSARQLRAQMLSAVLAGSLTSRFGERWYRDRAAGAFLRELLSAGQRDDANQLATQLGQERLTPAALLRKVDRWAS